MKRSRLGLGLALAASLIAVACGSGDSDGATTDSAIAAGTPSTAPLFDVNDVSILFNFAKTSKTAKVPTAFPEIHVDKTLLAPEAFTSVKKAASDHGIQLDKAAQDLANWRIFALRFDPCAPGVHAAGDNPAQCQVQLRLIAEALQKDGKQEDVTMHLVYTLGAADKVDLKGMRADLAKIKAVSEKKLGAAGITSGHTLGIHPGLAKLDPDVGAAVTEFVKTTLARPRVRTDVAFQGLEGNSGTDLEHWIFLAGSLSGNTFAPLPTIPNLEEGSVSQSFDPNHGGVEPSPAPEKLGTSDLFITDNDGALPKTDPKSLVFQVEDTRKTNFFNMDCVSCHTATNRAMDIVLTSNDKRMPIPQGVTAFISDNVAQSAGPAADPKSKERAPGQADAWSIRNFGWIGVPDQPSISRRTVNETADVVEMMNREASGGPLKPGDAQRGPGKNCKAVEDKVFDCFAKGGDEATCLAQCAPAPNP